jgi:hypothetical protein
VLIPKLLTQRKWIWYLLAIVALPNLVLAIPRLFEDMIREDLPQRFKVRRTRHRRSFFPYPINGARLFSF